MLHSARPVLIETKVQQTDLVPEGQPPAPLKTVVAGDSDLRYGLFRVISSYFVMGFEHILPEGMDHSLFVLGLFFFSTTLRSLLLQVTAFTLAHTVTLILSTLHIVNLSTSIVEPVIAISIVFVALENLKGGKLNKSRLVVVFGFGLLHGLGFAGALAEKRGCLKTDSFRPC